jgi:peptide/nickel transport system substrate-binding protein
MGSFDPNNTGASLDSTLYQNIYNQLIYYDEEAAEFVPGLAEKWDVSDDGLSYTFYLREGVKFHNGETLNADDVVFTIEKAQASPYLQDFVSSIEAVSKVDENAVNVALSAVDAPFLLDMTMIPIVEDKAYAADPEGYGQNPIGTGAYKFVKHDLGQSVVLERFEDYWEGPAPIKNVELKVITDDNTSVIALQSGEVDMVYKVPASAFASLESDAGLKTYRQDSIGVNAVFMNNSKAPFDNLLVRQAVNYAIDKDAVINMAENGLADKAEGILNKYTFGYSDEVTGYDFDPEKAKALLAEAGYPDGFNVTFKTVDGRLEKDAEVIQANLLDAGIKVSIEMNEANAFISDIDQGNYEMCNVATTLMQDADSWAMVFATDGGFDIAQYSNAEVDRLFKEASSTIDREQRLDAYKQLFQILNDDAVVAPVYFGESLMATKTDLNLGYIYTSGYTFFKDMSWNE